MRRWTNSIFPSMFILMVTLLPACSDDAPTPPPNPGPELVTGEMPLVPVYEVGIELPNDGGLLRSGMTGIARVRRDRRPLAQTLLRKAIRFVRNRLKA